MRASLARRWDPVEYHPTMTSLGFTVRLSWAIVRWYSMSTATCQGTQTPAQMHPRE